MAADFRRLMAGHAPQEACIGRKIAVLPRGEQRLEVAQLIDHHVSDES